jgi:cytochrome c biogenesis protein CcdA/thiol-disulfide isomerase/thioredoxin
MGKKAKKPETKPESVPGTPESAPGTGRNTILTGAVIAAVIIAVVLLAGATFLNLSSPQTPVSGITVYYFYGTECPHCHNVTPYIETLRQKYPDVEFRILEIWHNEENNALARLLNHNLNQTQEGVPEAVVGQTVLFGEPDITTRLENAILAQKNNLTKTRILAGTMERVPSADPAPSITATFFYGNGCSHCENVKPFIADIQARYPELRLEMLEINDNKTNRDHFLAMRTEYGLGFAGSIPTIFIGSKALEGEANVTDHFEESILAEKKRTAAGTSANLTPAAAEISVAAVYFYSDTCSHCEKIKPVIENISERNPYLVLTRLEINHNADNRQQLIDLSSRYNISNPGVPTLFIGDQVLIGEAEITNRFEAEIRAEEARIASGKAPSLPGISPNAPAVPALNPYMVILAALVDSANPCGLSVLVFLLISMAAAGNRRRILLVGGVYIAAMFLFHLFVGIGLFSAMAISGLTKPFSLIGGIIALVLGIITLADVLRKRETFLLSIPESGKGMLGTYARKATLPAAFVLGILAGILGFSCTGGIYISILGLMGRDMTVMAGLPYLVLYNIIFVLPLVLVTLLVAYGLSPDRAERWRTENKRSIRAIIGIILVALGLVILLGWLG